MRIQKENIYAELVPYYSSYDEVPEEMECIALLSESYEKIENETDDDIVLNISDDYKMYMFNRYERRFLYE